MPNIQQVLGRRNDLSTFVVHLTKQNGDSSPLDSLLSILVDGRTEARRPRGWGLRRMLPRDEDPTRDGWLSQAVVCFTEAPLEQISGLIDIDKRQVDLRPYGIAFTKKVARSKRVNPVWYIDTTGDLDGSLRQALDTLLDDAMQSGQPFVEHPVARLMPFFEEMGAGPLGSRKEFWWEREWRHIGDFAFDPADAVLVIAPWHEHHAIKRVTTRPCIDASWSLERMIASLAGLSPSQVTPFTG